MIGGGNASGQNVGSTPSILMTTPNSTPSSAFTVTIVFQALEDNTLNVRPVNFVVGNIQVTHDISVNSVVLSSFTKISGNRFTVLVTVTGTGGVNFLIPSYTVISQGGISNSTDGSLAVNYGPGGGGGSDYLINIYDWWVPNRNIVLSSSDLVAKWTGLKNSRILTPRSTGLTLPIAGIYTGSASYNPLLITTTNPGITGACSVDFIIAKSSVGSGTVTLFDTNTPVPRFVALLQISSGNTHMGITYNGVTYDCGQGFSYDGAYHTVSFVVDGANNVASIWLDNAQCGSNITITGGGLLSNTGKPISFFATPSGTTAFTGTVKAFRMYNEAHNSAAITLIHTGDFQTAITDNTPTRVLIFHGQSNTGPPTGQNVISAYSSFLQNGFPDIYYWQWETNTNIFVPIPANTSKYLGLQYPINNGPWTKAIYDWRVKYPTDTLRMINMYKSGTSLYDDWTALTGPLWTLFTPFVVRAIKTLIVEQRNLVSIDMVWAQGESEALGIVLTNNITVTNGSPNCTSVAHGLSNGSRLTILNVLYSVLSVTDADNFVLTTNYSGTSGTVNKNSTAISVPADIYATNLAAFMTDYDALIAAIPNLPAITIKKIIMVLSRSIVAAFVNTVADTQEAFIAADTTNRKSIYGGVPGNGYHYTPSQMEPMGDTIASYE